MRRDGRRKKSPTISTKSNRIGEGFSPFSRHTKNNAGRLDGLPLFFILLTYPTPTESTTNGSGKAETQNDLKIAPKTGFFYCLDRLHEPSEKTPKTPQRNAKNGKQGNGRTVDEYATPKIKPLNRPKTNESNADGQTLTESKTARKWAKKHAKTKDGESTATKHGERTPR